MLIYAHTVHYQCKLPNLCQLLKHILVDRKIKVGRFRDIHTERKQKRLFSKFVLCCHSLIDDKYCTEFPDKPPENNVVKFALAQRELALIKRLVVSCYVASARPLIIHIMYN